MKVTSHALTTSLLAARLGPGATVPPTEYQFVDRLRTAGSESGCRSVDWITAIYVGLKLHMTVCVHGQSRDRTVHLFDTLVGAIIGTQSEQALHLRGPLGDDVVAQRFAALRLGEFISAAADALNHDKVWFLIVDTTGDPAPMLGWIEREIRATLRANGWLKRRLGNLFVLVAASDPPALAQTHCLSLAAPFWNDVPAQRSSATLPPVGYQRYLLDHLLTGRDYRQRLRAMGTDAAGDSPLTRRWLAASVDDRLQGLWDRTSAAANRHKALAALRMWGRASNA
jgi:hypothetical protein